MTRASQPPHPIHRAISPSRPCPCAHPPHLIRRVDLGLVLQQQPNHRIVAVLGSCDEASPAFLLGPRAAISGACVRVGQADAPSQTSIWMLMICVRVICVGDWASLHLELMNATRKQQCLPAIFLKRTSDDQCRPLAPGKVKPVCLSPRTLYPSLPDHQLSRYSGKSSRLLSVTTFHCSCPGGSSRGGCCCLGHHLRDMRRQCQLHSLQLVKYATANSYVKIKTRELSNYIRKFENTRHEPVEIKVWGK